MPIIKYVAVHGSPLKLLKYVTNENKTEDTLITGLNCSTDSNIAYTVTRGLFIQNLNEYSM